MNKMLQREIRIRRSLPPRPRPSQPVTRGERTVKPAPKSDPGQERRFTPHLIRLIVFALLALITLVLGLVFAGERSVGETREGVSTDEACWQLSLNPDDCAPPRSGFPDGSSLRLVRDR
ncbi:MAG: hypothetical protein ABII00_11975 [Elusimicrobiota bacterium]